MSSLSSSSFEDHFTKALVAIFDTDVDFFPDLICISSSELQMYQQEAIFSRKNVHLNAVIFSSQQRLFYRRLAWFQSDTRSVQQGKAYNQKYQAKQAYT